MINRIGYACINMTLGKSVTTNRTMMKRTMESKGLDYISELSLKNCKDLLKILVWNKNNNVKFFRMSSDIIPWGNSINMEDLRDIAEIKKALKLAGTYANDNDIRLTFHPGPFTILSSPNGIVVNNAIKDLEHHGLVMDLLMQSKSPYNKINIHIGGTYGDKQATLETFSRNFQRLSDSVKSRLTIENDDKASQYTVLDLITVHKSCGVPIVFDYHHHECQKDPITQREALGLACSTWGNIIPVVHYSESKALRENDSSIKIQAHSDYINSLPETYGNVVDVMVEAKAKELSIMKFVNIIKE